jgi:hypothetical protein
MAPQGLQHLLSITGKDGGMPNATGHYECSVHVMMTHPSPCCRAMQLPTSPKPKACQHTCGFVEDTIPMDNGVPATRNPT